MSDIMDKLMTVCGGWSTNGRIICSDDPQGGIIDENLAGLGWFIIFNDERVCAEWFKTREDAIEYFITA